MLHNARSKHHTKLKLAKVSYDEKFDLTPGVFILF